MDKDQISVSRLLRQSRSTFLSEEEERVFGAMARYDQKNRDRLVESHLPLVVSMAYKFIKNECIPGINTSLEDLVQAGAEGLVQAAYNFDVRRGVRFSTYAWWYVRECMRIYHRTGESDVSLTTNAIEDIKRLNGAYAQFHSQLKCAPSPSELADVLGWDLPTLFGVIENRAFSYTSLDRYGKAHEAGEESHGAYDWVGSDDEEYSPEFILTQKQELHEQKDLLLGILPTLREQTCISERDVVVFADRCGLNSTCETRTCSAVAIDHKISKTRVQQIEAICWNRMPAPYKGKNSRWSKALMLYIQRLCSKCAQPESWYECVATLQVQYEHL